MTPPEPPVGYRPPSKFRYPAPLLAVASLLAFVAAGVGFGALLWLLRGRPDEISVVFDTEGLAVVVALLVATLVVHEAIHGAVYRLLDYRVSFGFDARVPGFYTAAFDQFVTRRDNLLVGLAPLAAVTAAMVPLLAVPGPVSTAAYVVLLVNTSGAVGDLYLAWRLLRLPPGTVLYDADIEHNYVFEPTRSDTAM